MERANHMRYMHCHSKASNYSKDETDTYKVLQNVIVATDFTKTRSSQYPVVMESNRENLLYL